MTRRRDSSYRVSRSRRKLWGKSSSSQSSRTRLARLTWTTREPVRRSSRASRARYSSASRTTDSGPSSYAAAADHHAGPLGASLFDDAVRIGQQQPFEHHLVVGPIGTRDGPGRAIPLATEQLIAEKRDLPRRRRINTARPQGRGEVACLSLVQQVETVEDVGRRSHRGESAALCV